MHQYTTVIHKAFKLQGRTPNDASRMPAHSPPNHPRVVIQRNLLPRSSRLGYAVTCQGISRRAEEGKHVHNSELNLS